MLKIETDLVDICEICERATQIAAFLTEMRDKGIIRNAPDLGWARKSAQEWIEGAYSTSTPAAIPERVADHIKEICEMVAKYNAEREE